MSQWPDPHRLPRSTRTGLLNAAVVATIALMAAPAGRQVRGQEAAEAWEKSFQRQLNLSDPANVPPAPPGSVGQAQRGAGFDVWPGFQKPPAGFGIVPFYWWLGDPLTKERLTWQLDQLQEMGLSGLQINYAHSDRGGQSYGWTLPSKPALFSKDWWDLTGWFMAQAKGRGIALSLSDYTLQFGQGWSVDELLRDRPDLAGSQLKMTEGPPPPETLITKVLPGVDGKPRSVSIYVEHPPYSYNPMHPESGRQFAGKFYGQFEDHFPGEGGKGLNFFFSDELNFRVKGWLWSEGFAAEFKKRKGYDILPELPALFADVGPRTAKIRMDYNDVQVALQEENYFKPVFDWHQSRGMTMGCDHGGRGKDVTEFGDYFRTQRWLQGPGSDQPNLGKNLIKAKVASSIAHLYQRPRVWLEGFYGSGWGTTPQGVVDATFADFTMGYNLLSFHGLYYSTHGGWWEWAPPCNGFHMPYWKHMRSFTDCVQRLAFLLSQGHHRCDVAIVYPVAAMEAGLDGEKAVKTAFENAQSLYSQGIDFDFIDFESLARAKVENQQLHVSDESYRVLVLPAMRAVRHSTLQKALEFRRGGGSVVALGALPEASDRMGLNDPQVADMVKEIFPKGVVNDLTRHLTHELTHRDFEFLSPPGAKNGGPYVMHRRIGQRDLYAIYNVAQGTLCRMRATGKVQRWDPWTGQAHDLPVRSVNAGMTELALPLTDREMQLIVFSPGEAQIARPLDATATKKLLAVEGDWEFELKPTLDNRFGDYHWPPTPKLLGAEARQLEYTTTDPRQPGATWRKVTNTFGPQFQKIGPIPPATQEATLKPDQKWSPYEFSWRWSVEGDPGHQGYHGLKAQVHDEFLTMGKCQLKMTKSAYLKEGSGGSYYFWTSVVAPGPMQGWAVAGEMKPSQVWLNGKPWNLATPQPLQAGPNPLLLRYDQPGRTYFVVADKPDAGDASKSPQAIAERHAQDILPNSSMTQRPTFQQSELAMSWMKNPSVLPFDAYPEVSSPVGWYRFMSPPGLKAMSIKARGKVTAWVDDQPIAGNGGELILPHVQAKPVEVLLKIEQERGCYGGAALLEPIELACAAGRMELGDWSKTGVLETYSGGAWYRKSISVPAAKKVVLDLGAVAASAEVRVNGKVAGILVAPPWKLEITDQVQEGSNRLEILVYNTLANHYTTIPTRYRGQPISGLLGPVTLEVE